VKLLNCPRVHSIFRRSETRMQRQASAIVPRDSGCGTPCVRTTTTEDEEEQEGKAPRRVDSPLWDRLPTERSFDGLEFTPEAETICNAIYSYFRLNLIESDDEEHDVDVESGEFELGQNPNIGLGGFLRRIIKYVNKAHCSNQDNEFLVNESSPGVRALVYSLILIDRLRKKATYIPINSTKCILFDHRGSPRIRKGMRRLCTQWPYFFLFPNCSVQCCRFESFGNHLFAVTRFPCECKGR